VDRRQLLALNLAAWLVAWALAILGTAACTPTDQLADRPCPPGSALTYESFGREFLAVHCQGCHGSTSSARRGAPSSYDFGTLEEVRRLRERIYARAAEGNVTMPPGPDDPPAAARADLADWLACGAP